MISRIAALFAALAVLPGILLLGRGDGAPLLGPRVAARLSESGVESAVTAVLLNFRSLDTFLEVTILAAAVVGILALPPPGAPARPQPPPSPLAGWLIPRLGLLIALLAFYLWWAGSSRPGGAFQAGAALTGLLLLLHFTRMARPAVRYATAPGVAVAGPLLFLGVGLLPLAAGAPFLDYPEGWAKTLILLIEAALSLSVGAALALLAMGGRGPR